MAYSSVKSSVWCVVRNSDGKFLLLKRSKHVNNGNLWNLPGGGIEDGEDTVVAGAREFHEECGVTVKNWKHFLTLNNKERRMCFIRPVTQLNDPKIWINSESSKYDWFSPKEIRALHLHFPTKEFFRNLVNKDQLEYRKKLVQGSLFLDITAHLNDELVAKAKICLPSRKLHNVQVSSFYQGLGYGDHLMQYLMSMPNHPTCLTANVERGSTMSINDLIKFYRKYGFEATDSLASKQKSGPVAMRLLHGR